MRIFLAGATGAIRSRLVPLLVAAGHDVTGTTRAAARADLIEQAGGRPVVVDVYDVDALTAAVVDSGPDLVIHQLTDLPDAPAARHGEVLRLVELPPVPRGSEFPKPVAYGLDRGVVVHGVGSWS